MQIVLGILESSWVDIGLAVVGMALVALGAFVFLKIKSVKQDIMGDVDNKIDRKIEPIEKRMDKHDLDFKEFKRDEIAPMKETINQLVTKQTVIDVKVDTIIDGIGDLKKLIGKIFDELNNKKDK